MTPYACRLFQEVFPVVSCSSQSFLLLFFFLFSLLNRSSAAAVGFKAIQSAENNLPASVEVQARTWRSLLETSQAAGLRVGDAVKVILVSWQLQGTRDRARAALACLQHRGEMDLRPFWLQGVTSPQQISSTRQVHDNILL
eukprot:s1955_g15.t2